jgi:hypothetical protein
LLPLEDFRFTVRPNHHERSKVLLPVHAETVGDRHAVQEVIATYGRLFEPQSVLWESSRVCVSW